MGPARFLSIVFEFHIKLNYLVLLQFVLSLKMLRSLSMRAAKPLGRSAVGAETQTVASKAKALS